MANLCCFPPLQLQGLTRELRLPLNQLRPWLSQVARRRSERTAEMMPRQKRTKIWKRKYPRPVSEMLTPQNQRHLCPNIHRTTANQPPKQKTLAKVLLWKLRHILLAAAICRPPRNMVTRWSYRARNRLKRSCWVDFQTAVRNTATLVPPQLRPLKQSPAKTKLKAARVQKVDRQWKVCIAPCHFTYFNYALCTGSFGCFHLSWYSRIFWFVLMHGMLIAESKTKSKESKALSAIKPKFTGNSDDSDSELGKKQCLFWYLK